MEVQEVEVFIDKNGAVHIEVHGIKGMSCVDLTQDLEEVIAAEVESREITSEAYENGGQQVRDNEQLRDRR